jgi:hypothetical protein
VNSESCPIHSDYNWPPNVNMTGSPKSKSICSHTGLLIHPRPDLQIECDDLNIYGQPYANPKRLCPTNRQKKNVGTGWSEMSEEDRPKMRSASRLSSLYIAKGHRKVTPHADIEIHGQTHTQNVNACDYRKLSLINICETVSTPVLFPFPQRERVCISFISSDNRRLILSACCVLQSQLVAMWFSLCIWVMRLRTQRTTRCMRRGRREILVLLMSVTHNKIIII